MVNEKLLELIKETGDPLDGLKYNKYTKTYYRFMEDSYTGIEICYWIDPDTELLLKQHIDDSPEQASGLTEKYVWYKDQWYTITSLADLQSFAVIDDKLYAIEFDRTLMSYNTSMCVMLAASAVKDAKREDFFTKSLGPKVLDELLEKTAKEVREFAIKEFKAGGLKHYVFDPKLGRYEPEE